MLTRAEDYNKIKERFTAFTKAWASTNVEEMDAMVAEDSKSYFSIFGSQKMLSRKMLKENLAVRTHKWDYCRIDINNYVCLIAGDEAQQIAYLNGLESDNSSEKYEHYCWSGQMANHWVHTSIGWVMDSLRFDLNLDDDHMLGRREEDLSFILNKGPGNIEFQSNWIGITDRAGWFQGTPLPAICPELDAPWYVIPEPENTGTDLEQCVELFYKYCFAIDTDCFKLFTETFSEYLISSIFWGSQDFRQLLQTLKLNRAGSRRCQHMGKLGRYTISEDHIYFEMYSKNPVTFMPFVLTKETEAESVNWCGNRWWCDCQKIDGKWRMVKFCSGGGALNEAEIID